MLSAKLSPLVKAKHSSLRSPMKKTLEASHCTRVCAVLPLFTHFPLENGWLSDRYRIRTDTGCIVSNRIWLLLYRPILRASLQVQQLLTGPITQQIKGHSRPSPAACCAPFDLWYGLEGREEGDCNLIPASPRHHDGAVLGLGHQRQMTQHPLLQQEVITTVSTVNHTNVSTN